MTAAPKADNLPLPPLPEGRFPVISLDPPWHFASRAPVANPHISRLPSKHYPTMDLEHIAALPIKQLATPDAFVFLWITGPLIAKGVHTKLFKAWGVRPSSLAFVWIKLWNDFDMDQLLTTPLLEHDLANGMGYTTRQNAEYVMLGRFGSPSRGRADIRQVIIAPRGKHSAKPDEYYRRVEFYAKTDRRLDMFAGAERPGWTSFGWSHREGERPDDAHSQVAR